MKLAKRVAALAAVLALCVSNATLCAGWQATPEARLACCANGTRCPMHHSESGGATANRAVTQMQADSCCAAASTRTHSSSPEPGFVLVDTTTVSGASILDFPPPTAPLYRRTLGALPASPVPKHLLFSVLLV